MRTHRPLRLETLESRTTPTDVTTVTVPPIAQVEIICPTFPPAGPTIDPNALPIVTGGSVYAGGTTTPLTSTLPPVPTTPPVVSGLGPVTPPPVGTPIGL